jgi:DNA-binding HxlR family transcriptional regulator
MHDASNIIESMSAEPSLAALLLFFRALADQSRLRIVGLLMREPLSGDQLAAMLGLAPSTVSHHLSRLSEAGIVDSRQEGPYSTFRIRPRAFDKLQRRLLDALPVAADSADVDAFDRRVLDAFLDAHGRLRSIPAQLKKRQAIIRHIVHSFDLDRRYTEKEVNAVLASFHPDISTLRRELIDNGLMKRTAGGAEYWRTE